MTDKTLVCRDCGQEFTFTASEQEFFAQKGFTNEPSRCPTCRAARKAGGNVGGFNGRRDRQTFPAVCAQCGKAAQVPFEPRNGRPVYCSDCYSAQRASGASYSSRGGSRSW
ncbi:MAG: zinc-ribbon domain containing protein [Chloroflexi bacterium]|nr:zinc-ribbon domain containing protein [Chloroflexota bacterium]